MQSARTDGRKASLLLFLMIFTVYSFVYMTKNCYSAAMASIVAEGVMTKTETGVIAAAFYVVYAPFQILGGVAADRYPPSLLILLGMLGAGTCNLLVYFTQDYVAMLVIWAINGVLQFGIWPSVFKIVATELREEHRLRGIVYISLSSTAGLLLSYLSAIFIADWKDNFLLSAAILYSLALAFFLGYRRLSPAIGTERRISPAPPPRSVRHGGGTLLLLLRAGVPLLLLVSLTQNLLNLGIKAVAPVMLMESYAGLSPAMANGMNILLVLSAVLGIFLSGAPVFRRFSPPAVLCFFSLCALPLLFAVAEVGRAEVLLVLGALSLLAVSSSATAVFFSQVARFFDRFHCAATLSGLFNCMASLGIVLANTLFNYIAQTQGWRTTALCWLALAALSFVASAVAVPVWRRFVRAHG